MTNETTSEKPVERRIAELHILAAREKALRLIAFTGAVFAGEWTPCIAEPLSLDLIEFSFHARRVNQICALEKEEFPTISVRQVNISQNDPGLWIDNYHHALNRIVHMESYSLGYTHMDHRKIFTSANSNLSPLYAIVSSDRFGRGTISLFGLASCFLISVIPLVKIRFPNFRF